MTKIIFKYFCNQKESSRCLVHKFTVRCIPILGLVFITVQLILWILYGFVGCDKENCVSRNNNGSPFFQVFFWKMFENKELLPPCLVVPPDLQGEITPDTDVLTWDELEYKFLNVQPGGRHKPVNCTSLHRVAVIVPFRDRDIHLKIFLNNIHPFLQRQQIDYGIFVVDLETSISFNRALLLNIGALEALKLYDYQCFIFHDVDLLPENDKNMYTCPVNPRHMSVAVDRMGYKLPYTNIFGGVAALTKDHLYKVNGYSNRYFGWGGEDDDMFNRLEANNLTIVRYPSDIAKYKMLRHVRQDENLARFDILQSGKRTFNRDGINSLKYDILTFQQRKLYTYILVYVNQTQIESGRGIRYDTTTTYS